MTQLALSAVLHSATTLMRTARWTDAAALLSAVIPADPAEAAAVAALQAEIAVDQDFAQAQNTAEPFLAHFEKALADAPDETLRWDLAMLTLRKTYGTALANRRRAQDQAAANVGSTGAAGAKPADSSSPEAQEVGPRLAVEADALCATAPDDARAGHAAFYGGVIADNLLGLPAEAFAHYSTALELGERSGDKMVISLALRHLGDHAHTAGDLKLARTHWERSTELRQQVGHLLGTLAQQTLLAVLLKDEGNAAGAATLATEINRWSRQVDLPWIVAQTAELVPDPTP